jgi:phosphopantothenate synthetase
MKECKTAELKEIKASFNNKKNLQDILQIINTNLTTQEAQSGK